MGFNSKFSTFVMINFSTLYEFFFAVLTTALSVFDIHNNTAPGQKLNWSFGPDKMGV
jgi:hypothetical protein